MNSFIDVIKLTFDLIYHNFYEILIVLLMNIIILFSVYLVIIDNPIQFNKNLIYFYIISYPITLFINTYLTIMIKDNFLKIPSRLTERFSKSIKSIPYCLFGTFILFFSYLLFIILFTIVIFIPIIRQIIFSLLVLLLIVFLGYFRFIPYTAVITNSTSQLFQKTHHFLSGHLWGSLIILFCIGIFIDIFNSLFSKTFTFYLVNGTNLFTVFLFFIIYQISCFIFLVFDIVYVTINYKIYLKYGYVKESC